MVVNNSVLNFQGCGQGFNMAIKCLGPGRPAICFLTAFVVLVQVCLAQADCLVAGKKLSPEELSKLQGAPASLFLNAQGGTLGNAELIAKVRDLVTSDKGALKLMTEALKLASAEEKSAIGTALGQAAQACLATEAGYAAEIQEALAASSDQSAILAFSAVTGNVPIGAAGGAGGAAGGAGGGAGGSTAGSGANTGGGAAATGGGGGGTPTATTITGTAASTTTTTTITVTTPTTGTAATNATTNVSP